MIITGFQKTKTIRKLIVILLAVAMLATGSGIGVFAEGSEAAGSSRAEDSIERAEDSIERVEDGAEPSKEVEETGLLAGSSQKGYEIKEEESDSEPPRILNIKVRLFDSDNTTELNAKEDASVFDLSLYLGEEPVCYRNEPYFVKDAYGNYCYFDEARQVFTSIGTKEFSKISAADIGRATFYTSSSGTVSGIPAGYSVELRDLPADTKFKVTAEDYGNPTGYGKRIWDEGEKHYIAYKDEGESLSTTGEENSVILRNNNQTQIEVHFQRGYGIRAEKIWSDEDSVSEHEETYFAVFVGNRQEPLKESVRRIDSNNYTVYYFPSIEQGSSFNDYKVREVKLNKSGDINSGVTIVGENKEIELGGNKYIASYSTAPGANERFRTEIVTNTREDDLATFVKDTSNQSKALANGGMGADTEAAAITDADSAITITDPPTPQGLLDEPENWALLNLILMLLTVIMAIIDGVLYFKRPTDKYGDEYEDEELKRHGTPRILAISAAVASGILFMLTEDITDPMIWVDEYTLWMLLLFIAGAILTMMSKKESDGEPHTI